MINNQRHFLNLAENSQDIIVIYDLNFKFEYCNVAVETYFGISKEHLIGRSLFDVEIPNRQVEFIYNSLKSALISQKIQIFEQKILNPNGEKYFLTKVILERDENGVITSILSVSRDISDQKIDKEDFIDGNEIFRVMFEKNMEAELLIDPETGLIIDANPAACEFYGYSREEILKLRISDINTLSQEQIITEMLLAKVELRSFFLFKHLLSNGEIRDVEVHSSPVNIQGRMLLFSLIRDITDRKRIEAAFKENEERFRSFYEQSPIGFYRTTPEGKILLANPTLVKMLGFSSFEELSIRNLSDDWFESSYPREDFIEKIEKNGEIIGVESAWKRSDGTISHVRESARAIRNFEGKTLYYDGTVEDITERKMVSERFQLQSAALESAIDAIAITDSHGIIEWANKSFENMTGYNLHEAIGKNPRELLKSGKHDFEFYKDMWDTILSGMAWQGEIINKRKDQTLFFEELSITPVKDDKGIISHFIAIKRDITEKKRIEESLLESEKKFYKMFHSSPIAMSVTTFDDGIFFNVNNEFLRIMERTREEVIGYSSLDIGMWVYPKQRELILTKFKVETAVRNELVELRTKSGKIIQTLLSAEEIEISNSKCLLISAQDISERIQSEIKLKENEERYKSLFNDAPVMLWEEDFSEIVDYVNKLTISGIIDFNLYFDQNPEELINCIKKMKIINVNDNCLAFYGANNLDDLIRNVSKTFTASSISSYKKALLNLIDGNPLFEDEMTQKTLFGEIRVVNIRSFMQRSEMQNTSRFLIAMVDITESKRAEEEIKQSNRQLQDALTKLKETQQQVSQQERMRALGQMASGICHDINNSLTPIMGYVDLLTDDKELMERNERSINMIIKSTKNIARTIGRLREFYKVKLTDEDLVEIDLNKVINSTIELTKHKWKNIAESTGAKIEIIKELEENLPLTRASESELIEALTNIIFNACDAMPSGGKLTFKTLHLDNDILLQIIDTGSGMDEEILLHCLDPFFSTKGDKGTGLGLAMVYGVIERHNGKMEINSEIKKGTCVNLTLPIRKEKFETKKEDDPSFLDKSLKILCVEDELPIIEMLEKMLKSRGHSIIQSMDGLIALDLFKKSINKGEPFDLVITDLGMPGLDGSSLSKEIKKISPEIPVILLTGWGTLIDKTEYPSIDFILNKPIMMKDLFRVINQIFKDKNV